ncbi:unnamed protein product, partial [Protopolystoma xenopodis]
MEPGSYSIQPLEKAAPVATSTHNGQLHRILRLDVHIRPGGQLSCSPARLALP